LSDPVARIELEIESQAWDVRAAPPARPAMEVIPSMCTLSEPAASEPAAPSNPAQALAMVRAGLGYLTACDAASLGTPVQAEALIGLEQAEAQHTVARAKILAAFSGQQGHQADGQYGPASWLRAFTNVTNGGAAGAVKWARRLTAHPLIADALAAGQLSSSWARALCAWTDQLPEDRRADADAILLAAAHGGATLADLGALALQMIERSRTSPDRDKDTFDDRAVWLETTIGGAGRLAGDLTGPAAAAVAAVLDALSVKGGAEDTRTLPQRQHDALAEACQRLIESGMLPGRDGQPLHLNVHVDLADLADLNGLPGVSGLEAGWSTARAAAAGLPGSVYLTGPDAEAAARDAALVPIVTGHIDWNVLDQLTDLVLDTISHRKGPYSGADGQFPELSEQTRERLQHTLLLWSIDLLSGPTGLASFWRRRLPGTRFTTLSQPLDLGRTTGPCRRISAKPSSSGTRNAASPVVSSRRRSARSTTSSPGLKAAPPPWATWHFSADTITPSSSTAGAGKSPANPTAPPPPPHPTDAYSTPTDHPPLWRDPTPGSIGLISFRIA